MNTRIINIVLVICFLAVLTSCATIIDGRKQTITFQSSPTNAIIRIDGNEIGKTPLTIELYKKESQMLTFEKRGHQLVTMNMDTKINPAFWGNILIGGVIGSTTDVSTGAIYEYSPGQYVVTLDPKMSSGLKGDILQTKKNQARLFLFRNYKNLEIDLSQNSGDYLNAMLVALNIPEANKEIVVQEIKTIMFNQNDPAEFVNITLKKFFNT